MGVSMGPILSSNNNANIQHILPSSITMPIPGNLVVVDCETHRELHTLRMPHTGSEKFVIGRAELIEWLGPFEGSEKVSRAHLEIAATDCEHGCLGDLNIRNLGLNGAVPSIVNYSQIPSYPEGEGGEGIEVRLAGAVSIGFRFEYSMMTDIGHFGTHDESPGIRHLREDIGHFGTHDESPGIRHLRDSGGSDPESAARLIEVLGASLDSNFTHIDRELLDSDARLNLISYTESNLDGTPDFKEYLSIDALIELVGRHRFEELSRLMDNDFSEIVLRRVEDHGMAINFHTDYARRTMQVILSDESDYSGCDLVYVTGKGFQQPRRRAGTATIHDNTILHGVTEMESGVRYSLFFLRNDSILQRAAH